MASRGWVALASVGAALASALGGCGGRTPQVWHAPQPAPAPVSWSVLASPTTESLRGLSVVDDEIVWASGAHGTVLRTTDGGATWSAAVIEGAEALDFRSLQAFDRDRAVMLAAGAPARAFRTEDGGAHWNETYTRDELGIFFDSIAFWSEGEGIAVGDPLPGPEGARFTLLVTHDGGAHWEDRDGPLAETGEAAFAASNGSLALPAPGVALFATGGAAAHVFRSTDGGARWSNAEVPVAHGPPSAGAFSIAFRDANVGFVVGGDYAAPTAPGSFARSDDGGVSWRAGAPLRGFRSSIAIAGETLIVVGTSGSERSTDDGETWTAIGETALNAVGIGRTRAFAVGPAGSLMRLALGGAR